MASASSSPKVNTPPSSTAPPLMPPPTLPPLSPRFGDELVCLLVGPKPAKFTIHKTLICESADFFKKGFTGKFKEASGEMYLPDDDPEVISLFVDWLYRASLPILNTEKHLRNLYELYFFADKLCCVALKDTTMDTIQDMARRFNLVDEIIKPELVIKVVNNLPTKLEGLLHFTIYLMVWGYLQRYDKREGDNHSESEYNDIRVREDEFPHIMRSDVRTVFHICMETQSFSFLDHFLHRLASQLHQGLYNLVDLRRRDEGDADDRCYFHCHETSGGCRHTVTEEELFFVPIKEESGTCEERAN